MFCVIGFMELLEKNAYNSVVKRKRKNLTQTIYNVPKGDRL